MTLWIPVCGRWSNRPFDWLVPAAIEAAGSNREKLSRGDLASAFFLVRREFYTGKRGPNDTGRNNHAGANLT